jgi:hypothetical protein
MTWRRSLSDKWEIYKKLLRLDMRWVSTTTKEAIMDALIDAERHDKYISDEIAVLALKDHTPQANELATVERPAEKTKPDP